MVLPSLDIKFIFDFSLNTQDQRIVHMLYKGQPLEDASDSGCSSENRISSAERIIHVALQKYGWRGIALGFNGGKDGTVILHLYYSILQRFPEILKEMQEAHEKIKVMDILPAQPFEEVTRFVETCRIRYNLNIFTLEASIKQGLEQFISAHPSIKAIIMGVRRGDPGSSALSEFSPTDSDWSAIMRINPILNWSYQDVWYYLLSRQIPYCTLYDHGYTSLGSITDTRPNPSLSRGDGDYLPAHQLSDPHEERKGRLL